MAVAPQFEIDLVRLWMVIQCLHIGARIKTFHLAGERIGFGPNLKCPEGRRDHTPETAFANMNARADAAASSITIVVCLTISLRTSQGGVLLGHSSLFIGSPLPA
ncbi:hypothetical protein V6Z79_004073 [Aspergillus fumigatus]|uniref:Uncharacterized protein n=1 Tax=Aspergillus fumigatus (strain CBS 144.89 / FGSC A1163 / CEA10) TaxID=451804 RepID=B0XYL5_ASPFC|nr:hypothetical protein AFUB_041330 [Aspergillus fumigatus A1163]